MSNLWIRAAYASLLALVVALTVSFGAAAAFPGPRPPDTPSLTFRQFQNESDNPQDADRLVGVVDRFYQDAYDFRRAYPAYQRNVFLVMVLGAIVVGGIGLMLPASFNYLRLGLTLGAILILVSGTATALAPTPNPAPTISASITNLLAAGSPPGLDFAGRFLRFAASLVALLVFLFLGLWRLTDWAPAEQQATPSSAAPASGTRAAPLGTEVTSGSSSLPQPSPESLVWKRPDTD